MSSREPCTNDIRKLLEDVARDIAYRLLTEFFRVRYVGEVASGTNHIVSKTGVSNELKLL